MQRVLAKSVSKLLLEQQKKLHRETAEELLDCANNDSVSVKTIITGDETWFYGYDPETKFQ